MGTWICHIRVAEMIFERMPGLDEEAFIIGSLSPDSGYPNADWTAFDPPKEVTHYLRKDETEANIRDFLFYRQWIAHTSIVDRQPYSFRLGYFFHLICDNLWMRLIARTSLDTHADLIAERGLQAMVGLFKSDWYGLDHIHVRDHPESAFWRVFMRASNPPSYLDFIPLDALYHQLNYIREYYSSPDPDRVLERPFPYLNEATMARFVQDCVEIILEIQQALQHDAHPDLRESSLELLDPARYAPYPPPLGD